MSPEVERILNVFREKGLHAGGMIHPTDFGDVIIWEGGFVRDEPVRQALRELFDGGYLLEYNAAFELTHLGAKHIYGEDESRRTV